jgi:Fe-S-cluster containining protein
MTAPVTPALQHAFDRERKDASRPNADDAQARAQTVRMFGRLARLQADVIAEQRVDVACERGCSYCCHLRVEIRPHEAFVLAHHIQSRLSAEQQVQVLARLEETLRRIAPLSAAQYIRAGIPCALLDERACSVYEGRPATCRKYYSVSVATCRDAFKDTAAPLTGELEDEQVRLAGNAVALGYAKGLEDAGYDTTLYELHFALYKALTDPKAGKRYRQRKKAFVGAD